MKARPTIIDVAQLAGVSKTTVSRVVNGDIRKVSQATIDKVKWAIEHLGYEQNTVASSLRTDKTNIVMLSIPDINNPFWPEVARGIQDFMELQGYVVVFANNDWDPQREIKFLRMARRGRFDGILINPIQVPEKELLSARIPTVIIGNRDGYTNLDNVSSDSYSAVQTAMEHLTGLGHGRIGFLSGISHVSTARSRLSAYRDFLNENNLEKEAELIAYVLYSHEGGMSGMAQLLDLPNPPTAVLASNDVIALGAMHLARERGCRIPDDISIMGIDGIYAASTTLPPLTTIEKQKYELGNQAARLLISRIKRKKRPCSTFPSPVSWLCAAPRVPFRSCRQRSS